MSVEVVLSLQEKIAAYERARRKGVEFLLANVDEDGTVRRGGQRVTFYRVPWALAVSGETGAAHRVLTWIEQTGLSADGEFHGGLDLTREANRTSNTYAETCLAYGAHLLRRFDLARRSMSWAERYLDAETGGVFMDRDRTGEDGPQLVFLTAQFGMSAAITGRLDLALKVGEWFRRLWEAQPELPEKLYCIWSRGGGLATTVPTGEDGRHYVNQSQEVRQFHYNGGIAAACLTHLFMTTGDNAWLDLARAYQRFSMESTPRQFETKQVCKSAWGSGLITLASGDDAYLDWLIRMGDWFAAEQEADGRWSNSRYLDPNPPIQHQIEATAEFVVHLDTLIGALAATSARRA
ncbi:MAG: hypothetical protein QOJ59_371 [Thermomicrobiales bacterium]|jgi:hypothetical protein|nr:hypothetical protein [Thermomicrobiales bacterium]